MFVIVGFIDSSENRRNIRKEDLIKWVGLRVKIKKKNKGKT